jgi:hypothetical protein
MGKALLSRQGLNRVMNLFNPMPIPESFSGLCPAAAAGRANENSSLDD